MDRGDSTGGDIQDNRSQRKAKLAEWLLAAPIRIKIVGLVLLPVLLLGGGIILWVRTSLSHWLSWLLEAERVEVAMQAGGRSVMAVTALAACLSLLIGSALMLVLTAPLLDLKRIADQVRRGDLERRVPVRGKDEIGAVADSFNRMVEELVQTQRELERSNKGLSALCHVSTAVGRGLGLEEVLDSALNSTLDVLGLDSAWVYLRDPEGNRFYLAGAVEPPKGVRTQTALEVGQECGCQLALFDAEGWCRSQLRECRQLSADQVGVYGRSVRHLSVPLQARGLKLGVLNILWDQERLPYADELDLLDAVARQISEAVANARLHADLQDKEAGMEKLLHSLVSAQEDERSFIAAELHDETGQVLTSILLRLKALEDRADAPDMKAQMSGLCTDLSRAIEHIRTLSHHFRPPDLDHLGLGPTLHNLLMDMFGSGEIEICFRSDLDGARLDPDLAITLYRIAQEALTNVTRHAQAGKVSVALLVRGGDLLLEVEDDGVGFNLDSPASSGNAHIGLAGIQERAERFGGSLSVRTAPKCGTLISVRLPRLEVVE